jgi:hypothetical protein
MEQRPLRLGDIVDDYCPRERRITNHVVAALMGDTIKQTRCSTCDVEHAYKDGRPPSRKKKDVALETAVLASVNGTQLVARIDPSQPSQSSPPAQVRSDASNSATSLASNGSAGSGMTDSSARQPIAAASTAASQNGDAGHAPSPGNEAERSDDVDPTPTGWFGHRTLIRATLPRTENEPPPVRPIPEFTMHQRQTRGSHAFRGGQGWGDRGRGGGGGPRGNFAHNGGNGNGPERNGNVGGNGSNHGSGFGGHHGGGQGHPGQGNGPGQGRPPGQGRKRHRHGKHRPPPR